ncbi:hypothetical protein [Marinomonas sp. THO17]|uniref:hypothetical protein n=1 Tax=Marinomonas sp. THO17 TaxID=3149048 RepID=UPI00336BEACA
MNDIGGPTALGGARQRTPSESLPVGTKNPSVEKLDGATLPKGISTSKNVKGSDFEKSE